MEILILLLLILLNGIFAMSEIAMVSSRKIRLEKSAKKGDRMAKKALDLSRNPGKFLSTVQIGITLIGILMGIYSGQKIEDDLQAFLGTFPVLQPYSDTLAFAILVILLTFFSLVLGELVPKRIGMTRPESISRILSYPMYWISIIAAPFIWLLTATSDLLIKILNIRPSKDSMVTEEEIKAIVQEGAETGVVQEIEQDIVENVFHLGDRRIRTLMTQRLDIEWIDVNDTPESINESIINSSYRSFPVCKGDLNHTLGIGSTGEMLRQLLKNGTFKIEECLKPALYLPENTNAYTALDRMQETRQRMALVVDEFGHVEGLLTMNDLINALVGDFEEHILEQKEIIPREDGSYLVDAALPFIEFARYFEIDISEHGKWSEISTVGGLILHIVKRIPEAGYKTQWKNLSIEVIDMDGRRIDKALVRDLSAEDDK